MKSLYSVLLAGVVALTISTVGKGQETCELKEDLLTRREIRERLGLPSSAGKAEAVTLDQLAEMLTELGYQPKILGAADTKVIQIHLGRGDMARVATIFIDADNHLLTMFSGGFPWAPNPARGGFAIYRKLLKINLAIAPSAIVLNGADVFGVTSVMGDSHVTTASLKAWLQRHQAIFETDLVPLVKELAQ